MAEQNITYQEVNEFVRRELKKHGKYLVDEFKENLTKNKNIDTGTLIGSLRYELFDPDEGGIGMRIVSAGDTIYGRLFEIAGKKRARLSKMPVNVNRIVWGINSNQPKRKKTQWYNKTMFDNLGHLVASLSAGMSEAELAEIRKAVSSSAEPNMKVIDH